MDKPKIGQIMWHDLTVPDATAVSEFYKKVVGWDIEAVSMGGYDDYCMKAENGETVSGVCHARGSNANIPPQWIMYVTVADLDESMKQCVAEGGQIIGEKRKMGEGLYCLIQDPAGAYMMLCG